MPYMMVVCSDAKYGIFDNTSDTSTIVPGDLQGYNLKCFRKK